MLQLSKPCKSSTLVKKQVLFKLLPQQIKGQKISHPIYQAGLKRMFKLVHPQSLQLSSSHFSKYTQSTNQSIKITSLQYLCNILRKRWGINMIFCMKINKFSIVSFRLVITSHAQSTSTQNCKMKLTFCMHIQISIKLCFKLIPLILLSMARHARIMQNNKFAKSLQYLQKELSYEADGLHAESHENL